MSLFAIARSRSFGTILLLGTCWFAATLSCALAQGNRYLFSAQDIAAIETALASERLLASPIPGLTGVTVPHHVLAADLIARGLLAASAGNYQHILLLSPDHFRSLRTPFGVTTGDLSTLKGTVQGDDTFSERLLQEPQLFTDVGSASHEHGIHAVLPFIKAVFPNTRVTAIVTATHSTPHNWRAALDVIEPLIAANTLIVQSTDFSHFLPVEMAVQRDQETIAAISSGDLRAIAQLSQPSHLDSLASQYMQSALQQTLFQARPIVIANRNSSEYAEGGGPTTSYIVTVFTTDPDRAGPMRYADTPHLYFAGDTFIGRGWLALAQQPDVIDRVVNSVRALTGGGPLIVNLEGVLLEELPAGANPMQHFMPAAIAIPVLKRLGVVAASLANNHAYDFGEEGATNSSLLLDRAGILPLHHFMPMSVGNATVLPLTLKKGYFYEHDVVRTIDELQRICSIHSRGPLIAFMHWGPDYTSSPSRFEGEVLEKFQRCGLSLIVGAHSHRASDNVELRLGGHQQSVFSMGNFIFDQSGPAVSGSLVEVRFFKQGTVAVRIIPHANHYDVALDARSGR